MVQGIASSGLISKIGLLLYHMQNNRQVMRVVIFLSICIRCGVSLHSAPFLGMNHHEDLANFITPIYHNRPLCNTELTRSSPVRQQCIYGYNASEASLHDAEAIFKTNRIAFSLRIIKQLSMGKGTECTIYGYLQSKVSSFMYDMSVMLFSIPDIMRPCNALNVNSPHC